MSIIEDKNKLERLDQLIRLEMTGSPGDLAFRLNTSKRTVYRTINILKQLGCPIYFCRNRISYCYKTRGRLIIKFEEIEKMIKTKHEED